MRLRLVAATCLLAAHAAGARQPAGILSADEGEYVDGRWVRGLRMNGDQTHQGRHVSLGAGEYTMQRVRLYRYR